MSWKGRNLAKRFDVLEMEVKGYASQRLDHYLGKSLNWRSRSRLQALIKEGRVRVNGDAAKPSRKVRQGDRVSLELSMGTGLPEDYDHLELEFLYEDPWLVAVNKPAGILVHPVGRHVYDTLINHLHHHYRDKEATPGAGRDGNDVVPRLCHRIDRDTTGCLLVAKDSSVHRDVMYQFENRIVSKEYHCLVRGRLAAEEIALTTPIGEGRTLEECLEHDVLKVSRTDVRVLRRFREATYVSCVPQTGRQNQIRVHLAAAGHPLVGDERYGGCAPPAEFPQRFLLHSRSLRFFHRRLRSWVELVAPLPRDFAGLLRHLEEQA